MAPKQAITVDDVIRVIDAIATNPDPQAAFGQVDALVQKAFGHKLLTVLRYLPDTVEVERVYSSNPEAYPLGGRKQKPGTPWGERVLDRGEIFIAHGPADIEWAFSDHALIFSLGITGMMNVPILFRGRCIGTLNISHEAGRFTDADAPMARLLAGLLVPLLLSESKPV